MDGLKVYIEKGKKKAFIGALDFPGWTRWGKDEDHAIDSLIEYAPRYANILEGTGIDLQLPIGRTDLKVVERLEGNATTDFGAPGVVLESDKDPVSPANHEQYKTLLRSTWKTFDRTIRMAEGQELRKGPRGGGRDLEKIVRHVLGGDHAYLRRLAWKYRLEKEAQLPEELQRIRFAILEALDAGVQGDLPEKGPRGGVIWPVRFFIRRVIWHTLDHTWEIEDRLEV